MKNKIKTINDLPRNISLGGLKFKHPETGEACYWRSQWQKGVWYKKDLTSSQIFPLFVNDLKEALKFEVIE
ncbi:MAG: hypothetical protein AABY22_11265 [Nanoarchaeota archaeon]